MTARERVQEYLRQFDRLPGTGGVIHSAATEPDGEPARLTADDLRIVLAEGAIPPGRCGVHFEPAPDLRYTCELLAGHAGWHQETRFPEGEPGVLRIAEPQVVQWNRVQ